MNLIFQLLIATLFIAGMILFRLLMDRRALRTKIRSSECEQTGCFDGCSNDDQAASENDFTARPNT